MKKTFGYLLTSIFLFVLPFTLAAQNGKIVKIPANRLFPKTETQTKALVVVDLQFDSRDAQISSCVLQGIVNRSSKKKIYVKNTYCFDNRGGWARDTLPGYPEQAQMAGHWLKELFANIPQESIPLNPKLTNPGLKSLVSTYASYIKGLIIYDPDLKEATIEAATTIAGQTDGLVVSPAIAAELEGFSLPVLMDLRSFRFQNNISCLKWLKDNYFATANKQVAFTWSHMTTDKNSWGSANKDYVVANKLFTFFLNIENKNESSQYGSIIKEYPAGTPVMGWTDERFADKLFADYGYFIVPFISVENLSVMSSFPSVTGSQAKPKAYPISNKAVYISFQVPDGDNLLHTMVYKPYTILNSKNFGAIPLTWIINPAIVDLAPPAYNWFLSKFAGKQQELGAMMGDGSPRSDRYAGYSFYCDLAVFYMKKAGIVTLKQMAEGEAVSWKVQPYVLNSGYAGTDSRGLGPYEYHLNKESFHTGTLHMNEHNIKKIIEAAPVNQPLFLSIFAGTAASDIPTAIKKFCDELQSSNDGHTYYFVRSMDLAATYRKWKGLPVQ